jgi:hypothetical protein
MILSKTFNKVLIKNTFPPFYPEPTKVLALRDVPAAALPAFTRPALSTDSGLTNTLTKSEDSQMASVGQEVRP